MFSYLSETGKRSIRTIIGNFVKEIIGKEEGGNIEWKLTAIEVNALDKHLLLIQLLLKSTNCGTERLLLNEWMEVPVDEKTFREDLLGMIEWSIAKRYYILTGLGEGHDKAYLKSSFQGLDQVSELEFQYIEGKEIFDIPRANSAQLKTIYGLAKAREYTFTKRKPLNSAQASLLIEFLLSKRSFQPWMDDYLQKILF